MSHFVNANPLDYDVKYPQTADTSTNDKAKIVNMEKNVGREVMFQIQETQFYGKITGVPNSEHYSVVVGESWEWYIREEAIHFIEQPTTKL